MLFVLVLMVLAAVAAGAALLGFPIYYWVQDRRRRGMPVAASGLLGAAIIGLLGVVAIWVFLTARP